MNSSFQPTLLRLWHLACFEITRVFQTKSGLLALFAFLLVWFLILYYPVNSAFEFISSPLFKDVAKSMFGALGLSTLLKWPVAELAIYWLIALYIFPIFTIVITSDQTCADRERGTLRFISLRATRGEIIFGRFLGQLVIMTVLIGLSLVTTVLMVAFRDSDLLSSGILKASQLYFQLVILVLPFIALMTLFNSFTTSAKKVVLFSILFFGLGPMIITLVESKLPILVYLGYLIPGTQISDVINSPEQSLTIYLVSLSQMMAFLCMAYFKMKRCSL
ncbi:hypothetical protein RGQ13_11275 [Thalassotalea psychrophila]|uniref:Uncharacterized protein n=1 Tax=Thalassotalea psychrophila TaxID=3065647 RepID=A0ABY9TPE8_9GAMM|nr:hypothetical protein RGQ13_11275 [Colwelliaceae bacterium SQ149]